MPLEIAKLSKRLGSDWVLRDVEFRATEGRVFGICGASSSGKSTLLGSIAGGGKTRGARMALNGQDLTKLSSKDRGFYLLTNKETARLSDIFGRGQKGSSSERQLKALEAAIANAGKVLLLDDPFTQMDERLRDECFAAVRRAARSRDRIVIFASSDFDQLARVADEMAVLAGGEIKQTGTPQEIYEKPETVDVAQISGENNLFEARRLTSTDADLPEFHTIAGGHRIFAQAVDKSRLGAINQNMTLAIRPEQVSISIGSSFPEDNLLRGVVSGIKFRGPTSLIEFDAAGLKLEARAFKVVGLELGDECMLGLPPHRILILRD
jgi:ABC-type Fe3+/spermidine/putrescine transport system ATPase subunit